MQRPQLEHIIRAAAGITGAQEFIIIGSQIIDLSGVNSIDQALAITRSEFDGLIASDPIALISIPPSRGL